MSRSNDERMRRRLSAYAAAVAQWKDARDHVSKNCVCVLPTIPGFQPFDNVDCRAGRRCLAMTVLSIRVAMSALRIDTRKLAAADIPQMVDDLAALFAELPSTTDWLAFANRLQAIATTGRDPNPATAPEETTQP